MKKLFLFLLFISVSFAQPQLPELKSYANDLTGTLNPDQIGVLNNRLKTFDDSTSNQIVLLIVPTINDYPLEEYANEIATKNKIGTKKSDNGILFLIVKDDKKIRIEVGYGLEGALPDALASSIIRNVVVPNFKRNDYYSGISEGIDAIVQATKGEYKAVEKKQSRNSFSGIITILIIIFFLISSIFRGGRRRGGGFFFPGGFGGGGFSSGGGGGFSGGGFSGGGGGFGGGGSSGGW
jgi:uncharacterized protein